MAVHIVYLLAFLDNPLALTAQLWPWAQLLGQHIAVFREGEEYIYELLWAMWPKSLC